MTDQNKANLAPLWERYNQIQAEITCIEGEYPYVDHPDAVAVLQLQAKQTMEWIQRTCTHEWSWRGDKDGYGTPTHAECPICGLEKANRKELW